MTAEGKLLHEAHELQDPSKLDEYQKELFEKTEQLIAKLVPAAAMVKREIKFPILGEDYGYGDLVALHGNTAWYIDYKYGNNKQEPVESNPAAQAYALGIMKVFPYITNVKVYYIYPRLEHLDGCTYYRSDVDRIVASIQLIKAGHNAATPDTCQYHPDTCGWCRHLVDCQTARKALLPVINTYAKGHEVEGFPDLSLVTDPEKWAKLLSVKPIIAQLAESITRHALAFSEENEIPGYVRKQVKGKMEIQRPKEFVRMLEEKGVDPQRLFLECTTISATKAFDLLKETLPRGQKAKVVEEVKNQMSDEFVLGTSGGYIKLERKKHGDDRLQQPERIGDGDSASGSDV